MIQIQYPQFLKPEQYDLLLAQGWFRSSFMMYRSDVLCINSDLNSIVNIRMDLEHYAPKKRHRKLLRKNDSIFDVQVTDLNITDACEQLYDQQKVKFQGFVHQSLKDYLFANMDVVPYNTKQVEIRLDDQLVAVSFVDFGKDSMASILALYDLEMSQYSLGNYSMLKEIEYGKNHGLKYFYPGYILDLESSFNYKLHFAPCQYLNKDQQWVDFSEFDASNGKAHIIRNKIQEIEKVLSESDMDYKRWYYPYFSFGFLNQHHEINFLEKALFLEFNRSGFHRHILSYDVYSQTFQLEIIWPFAEPERFVNVNASSEYLQDESCYMVLSEKDLIDADRDLLKLLKRNLLSFRHRI